MNKQEATKIRRERFAADYGMTLRDVQNIVRLGNEIARLQVKVANGEPAHKDNALAYNREDTGAWKTENARLWRLDFGRVDAKLEKFVSGFGFTVDYAGLYPNLMKDGHDVRIPY